MTPSFFSRRALVTPVLLAPLAGCSASDAANALTPRAGIMRESGLAYGPLPRQRMDLYRPADLAEAAPLLVFIHGGGWRDGAREQYAFLAQPMARLGLMVAIPDYRLWPGARFPAFVEDAALAVRMLAARERRRRLVLMGHSAGAFNAACLALDPSWGVQEAVGGFIGLAGPYDFRADEVNPPDIFPQPRIQAAPAPLRAVTTPPLLLLHGEADTTVGPYHSRILAERATTAGVRVRHVAYPGMSHLGIIAAMASPALWLGLADARVRDEVSAFLLSSADGGVAPR